MDPATLLRQARKGSRLTLRALAERAGTSHATLSAYESGRKVPTTATFARIVRAAGFDLTTTLTPLVGDIDPADRGRELEEVLELAAQFPARHHRPLRFPIFGRA